MKSSYGRVRERVFVVSLGRPYVCHAGDRENERLPFWDLPISKTSEYQSGRDLAVASESSLSPGCSINSVVDCCFLLNYGVHTIFSSLVIQMLHDFRLCD